MLSVVNRLDLFSDSEWRSRYTKCSLFLGNPHENFKISIYRGFIIIKIKIQGFIVVFYLQKKPLDIFLIIMSIIHNYTRYTRKPLQRVDKSVLILCLNMYKLFTPVVEQRKTIIRSCFFDWRILIL